MIKILHRQVEPLIKMIQNILQEVDNNLLHKMVNRYQFWKLIYHPLYWMDYHLSDKSKYQAPEYHITDLNKLDVISDKALSKNNLIDYCKNVEKKLYNFIDKIDSSQSEKNETGLDILLGQIRHVSFHIGMLYTFILYEKNKMLDTIGAKV